MISETCKTFIEESLDETIEESRLLAETYPSRIYHVSGKRQYVLKETRQTALNHQFANHKRIFEAWLRHRDALIFKIPEPFLLGPEGTFILMEYVGGNNLLNLLLRKRDDMIYLFHRAGQALRQYHDLAKDSFKDNATDLKNCDSIREIMSSPKVQDTCPKSGQLFDPLFFAYIKLSKQPQHNSVRQIIHVISIQFSLHHIFVQT